MRVEVKPRRFPVRPIPDLDTSEKVERVRQRLAERSAAYRAMTKCPFSIIASGGGREEDIPF
ncbi:hypothetical protein AB0B10_26015 [Micromonospora arborensis]|uniref:hypothetical protein n=1 Tax=Micromonospora arborensis TaxID=2116518 RepID=UPI00340C54CC